MPELPEVETTRRGIAPFLVGHAVRGVIVRDARLRWRVPSSLERLLPGQTIESITRRAKYLVIKTAAGSIILHLGMSGSLRVVPADTAPEKFDHVDIVLDTGQALRLRDPRRFGAVLWTTQPEHHALLKSLGPEPLDDTFSGNYLFEKSRKRKRAIKDFLMDSRIVAGIGNIYANESLFLAGIRPTRAAGRLSREQCRVLADAIRKVLTDSIAAGGTTLRDFQQSDGRPGYFKQSLRVYARAGKPCAQCGTAIKGITVGSRSAFYCSRCQS